MGTLRAVLLALSSLLGVANSAVQHRQHSTAHRIVAESLPPEVAAILSQSSDLSSTSSFSETTQKFLPGSSMRFKATQKNKRKVLDAGPVAEDPFAGERTLWTMAGQDSDDGKGEMRDLNSLVPVAGDFKSVIIMWHLMASWVKFDVPENIFDTSKGAKLAVPLTNFKTNDALIESWLEKDPIFCNSISSEVMPGASTWAIKSASDTNTACGCSGESNAGQGVFYGGFPENEATECKGEGGGFAGPSDNGMPKGGVTGTAVTIYVMKKNAAAEEEAENPNIKWEEVCQSCTIPTAPGGKERKAIRGGPKGATMRQCQKKCEEDPDCNYIEFQPLAMDPVTGLCFLTFGGSFKPPGLPGRTNAYRMTRVVEDPYTGNQHNLESYQCAVGFYLDTRYVPSRCLPCPAGAYCLHEQKQECVDGQFNAKEYQTVCLDCPKPLTSESNFGHEECYCAEGTYGVGSPTKSCPRCKKGSFCQHGVTKLCAAETCSPYTGAGSCRGCARGKTTQGRRGQKICVCKEGYYPHIRNRNRCIKCLPGYTCPGSLQPECPEGGFEMQTTRLGQIVACMKVWPEGAWSFLSQISNAHPHKEEILKAARENDGLLTPKMVALLHGNEIVRRQTPAEADELYDGENGDANVNGDINRPPFSRLVDKLNKGSR